MNFNSRFIWTRTAFLFASSRVTISWEIPKDTEPGEYRIRHNGYYRYILGGVYPYQGVTNHFQVRIILILIYFKFTVQLT